MVLVIGLAGTIAAGKSTVGDLLERRGATHCDADKLVHRLYDPGTPGFDRVVAAFGEDIVGGDGFIDRKLLGAKVFGKPAEMSKLTRAIGNINDAVHKEIDGWRERLAASDVAVMEAVNLMDAGYGRWCDQTWLVGVTDDVARRRLVETRNMAVEEADQRLRSMRLFKQREPGADWTYQNDGTLGELDAAVTTELDRIIALHRAGTLKKSKFGPWFADELERNRPRMEAAGAKLPTPEEFAELRRQD
jgi:dephospho-CoA kinase